MEALGLHLIQLPEPLIETRAAPVLFSPVRAHQPVLSMRMRGVKSVCASPSKSWISLEECSEQAAQERMRVRVLSAGINKDGRRVSASCTNTTRYPEHVARW